MIICSYLKNECILNKQTNKKKEGEGFLGFVFFLAQGKRNEDLEMNILYFEILYSQKKFLWAQTKKGGKNEIIY